MEGQTNDRLGRREDGERIHCSRSAFLVSSDMMITGESSGLNLDEWRIVRRRDSRFWEVTPRLRGGTMIKVKTLTGRCHRRLS